MPTNSDDFNRADSNPIQVTSPWWSLGRGGAADWKLVSNHAEPISAAGDSIAIWKDHPWGVNQAAYGNLTVSGTLGGGRGIGFVLRCLDDPTTRTCYEFVADHAATLNCFIQRFVGGTYTALDSFTQAFTDGDRWGFKATGPPTATILEVFYLGSKVRTFTDNSSIANGSPGLGFSSATTSASLDNWEAWDLDGRPQKPVDFIYLRQNK